MNQEDADKLEIAFLNLEKKCDTDELSGLFNEVMRRSYGSISKLNAKLHNQTLDTQKAQNKLNETLFLMMKVNYRDQ